ncbi:hypothetical protein LZC95_16085 [Pendulispora brunnea]|uniref:Insecticide toxin TcdB middle/N-terminal domain-containing protein n=1 Tax=Pendulispora brunnea TaxID=2905690 RepID=A0ABZ2KI43_9BACT
MGYLTDIFDTPPASARTDKPAEIPLEQFAHHTRLAYNLAPPEQGELFPDAAVWHARRAAHLEHVDVTSVDFKNPEKTKRHLIRRYTLSYLHDREHRGRIGWWLRSVHLTGACPEIREDDSLNIPNADCVTQTRSIANMTYSGRRAVPSTTFVNSTLFERQFLNDRPGQNAVMFTDVNADSRPDVIATTATSPNTLGLATGFGWEKQNMNIQGGPHDFGSMLTWGKLGPWNNDGQVNILMWGTSGQPDSAGNYTVYSPKATGSGADTWSWVGTPHVLPNHDWLNINAQGGGDIRDIDGDGLPDAHTAVVKHYPNDTFAIRECDFFSTRDEAGRAIPYARGPANPNVACIPPDESPGPSPRAEVTPFYADLSGDGIPDAIRREWEAVEPGSTFYKERWSVSYGLGNGRFGASRSISGGRTGVHQWLTEYPVYFQDLNGDGLADKIELRNNDYEEVHNPELGIYISWANGLSWQADIRITPDRVANWAAVYRVPGPGGSYGSWYQPMRLDFIPSERQVGTQLITVITDTSDSAKYQKLVTIEVDWGAPEPTGLLESFENGLGAITKIIYDTPKIVPGVPTFITPVNTISTKSNGDVQSTGGPFETFYDYSEPVYGYRDARFAGFRKVRTLAVHDGGGYSITDTRYLIASCQDSGGKEVPCPESVDDPHSAIRGLPVTVDQSGGSPVKHASLAHGYYQMDKLYTGLDGRGVRRVYTKSTDTWIFDTANYVSDGREIDVTDLVSDELTVSGRDRIDSQSRAVVLRTSQELDLFGNLTVATDSGVATSYDPVVTPDSPIVNASDWTIPAGDTSRWLWRPKDTYVRDASGGTNLRHSHFEYDATGNTVKTFSDLTGTIPLLRFHQDSAAVAPLPADASQDGTNLLLSEVTYDEFGNQTRVKSGNGVRCTDTSYDVAYGQLPVSQTVYTRGCGGAGLTTTTLYDRGLEVATETIAPTGAKSTAVYDGLGRMTASYKPNAELGVLAESDPSVRITYVDVAGGPYQRVRVEKRDNDDNSELHYHSTWTYTDSFGQIAASVSEADTSAGDEAPYIVSDKVERNNRGFVVRTFQPYFAPVDPASATPPAGISPSTRTVYDPFGRVTDTFGLANEPRSKLLYHALSQESYDAADLVQGATPHPTRTVQDGHGRTRLAFRTTNQNGTADTISTETTYLPTGEVKAVRRSHSAGADTYVREMRYDSWGRLVQNEEPNTSINRGTANVRAWRYAYNDSNELVGTSDARGCGKNAEWDGAGRLISETYSPCLRTQRPYNGHVTNLFVYDRPEGDAAGNPALFAGKLAASYDRAQHTRYTYDGRGRITVMERRLALPDPEDQALGGGGGPPSAEPGGEYAPHWYRTASSYDQADREKARSVGARSTEVQELYGTPVDAGWLVSNDMVVTTYSKRGTTKTVGSSYGNIVLGRKVGADGFVLRVDYGETASPAITYEPDEQRRLLRMATTVAGTPKVLQDWTFSYDAADNPKRVSDNRTATEWPEGAKPVSQQMSYDDLNQLRRVDYDYGGTDDKQVSPFAAEAKAGDTRPIPGGPQTKRVKWQSYDFDWQGNLIKSDDDSHAFHDRSVGSINYGTPAKDGPNRAASAVGLTGRTEATYDRTGNLVGLFLRKLGPNGNSVDINFSYDWDEVGQMVRAKREPIPGGGDRGADFHYTYDSAGTRVTKSVEDPQTHSRTYSSEIFPTLRLDNAPFQNGDYKRNKDTVTLYLISNGNSLARVVYDEDMPLGPVQGSIGGAQHVFFELTDPMGSTSSVIDKWTGELVERTTYLAYGQTESDYRPERWKAFREHYRFTGKEDDVGVGLTYFGARYYIPALGQWASADPLTVHKLESDLNPYAYVLGSPQRLVDPNGLAACDFCIGGDTRWDLGWSSFFAGSEAQSLGWTQTGGGTYLLVSGLLPIQVQLYKRTDRDQAVFTQSTLTREELARDPTWWRECGKNPWCAPPKDLRIIHLDTLWEPIGLMEARTIARANVNAAFARYTASIDRPLERPALDPIDIAAGGLTAVGRAVTRRLVTRTFAEFVADETGSAKIPLSGRGPTVEELVPSLRPDRPAGSTPHPFDGVPKALHGEVFDIMADLQARRTGDAAAATRLAARNEHLLTGRGPGGYSGWTSLDVAGRHVGTRFLYKEERDGIKWMVRDTH